VWLAHALTLVRIPLAALFWFVATDRVWGAVVIGVAALTDVLDGRVARRALRRGATGHAAEAGAWLDPLCDKLFAVTVLVALAVRVDTPIGMLALVATRELVVGPLAIAYRMMPSRQRYQWDFHASRAGKHATVAQFVAVTAFVVALPGAAVLAVVAAAFGLVAVVGYVRRAARVFTST